MLMQVQRTIDENKLIQNGDKVLVALSGGADSVCLLDVLQNLKDHYGIMIAAAHLHHGLRGEDADHDEAFAKELCLKKGIPFFSRHVDVKSYAKNSGMTIEEAGRTARYNFFRDVCQQEGFTKIATAHHAGDNAETVLMHLLRGASISGMAGIPYQNNQVIRPLLDVTRQDIEAHLEANGQAFCTDSTNTDTVYTRNRIRNELLPLIERDYNSNFVQTVLHNTKVFKECSAYIKQEAESLFLKFAKPVFGGYSLAAGSLNSLQPFMAKELLRYAVNALSAGKELDGSATNRMYQLLSEDGQTVCVLADITAQLYDGCLYIRHDVEPAAFSYSFEPGDIVEICETGAKIECFWLCELSRKRDKNCIYIDKEKIRDKQLMVRSRRKGDVFCPAGMNGKKSIKTYFIDEKIPRFLRSGVPLVTADDEVVWVAGHRADARYIADANAEEVLCLRLSEGDKTNDIV